MAYYAGPFGQLEDNEVMHEVGISTDNEELGTDQYDNFRLQRDFNQKCGEHKELSHYV